MRLHRKGAACSVSRHRDRRPPSCSRAATPQPALDSSAPLARCVCCVTVHHWQSISPEAADMAPGVTRRAAGVVAALAVAALLATGAVASAVDGRLPARKLLAADGQASAQRKDFLFLPLLSAKIQQLATLKNQALASISSAMDMSAQKQDGSDDSDDSDSAAGPAGKAGLPLGVPDNSQPVAVMPAGSMMAGAMGGMPMPARGSSMSAQGGSMTVAVSMGRASLVPDGQVREAAESAARPPARSVGYNLEPQLARLAACRHRHACARATPIARTIPSAGARTRLLAGLAQRRAPCCPLPPSGWLQDCARCGHASHACNAGHPRNARHAGGARGACSLGLGEGGGAVGGAKLLCAERRRGRSLSSTPPLTA